MLYNNIIKIEIKLFQYIIDNSGIMSISDLLNDNTLTTAEYKALYIYFEFHGLLPKDDEPIEINEPTHIEPRLNDKKLRPEKVITKKWAPEKFKMAIKKKERRRMRDYKTLQ